MFYYVFSKYILSIAIRSYVLLTLSHVRHGSLSHYGHQSMLQSYHSVHILLRFFTACISYVVMSVAVVNSIFRHHQEVVRMKNETLHEC